MTNQLLHAVIVLVSVAGLFAAEYDNDDAYLSRLQAEEIFHFGISKSPCRIQSTHHITTIKNFFEKCVMFMYNKYDEEPNPEVLREANVKLYLHIVIRTDGSYKEATFVAYPASEIFHFSLARHKCRFSFAGSEKHNKITVDLINELALTALKEILENSTILEGELTETLLLRDSYSYTPFETWNVPSFMHFAVAWKGTEDCKITKADTGATKVLKALKSAATNGANGLSYVATGMANGVVNGSSKVLNAVVPDPVKNGAKQLWKVVPSGENVTNYLSSMA